MGKVTLKFDPILPKSGLDFPTKLERRFRAEVTAWHEAKVKPTIKEEFEKFTARWEHQVNFVGLPKISRDEIRMTVFPRGANRKIFEYVSGGVRPRLIKAKTPKGMVFRPGYISHTTTRPSGGGPGIRSGPLIPKETGGAPVMLIRNWQGIKPRNFEKDIKRRYQPVYTRQARAIFASVYR